MLLSDCVVRRSALSTSLMLQVVKLVIVGVYGAANASVPAVKAGMLAIILLYSFGWSSGYAPLAYVVAAELPSPHLHEYTLRVGYTVKLVT